MVKYPTYTCNLVWALESASLGSCKTPATFIDSIHPTTLPEESKEPRIWIQLPTNHIIPPWAM